MSRRFSLAPLTLAGLVLVSPSVASDVDPLLEEELRAAPPNALIDAIFFLSDPLPVRRLAAELDLRQATRADRHQEVGLALQTRARQAQRGLLEAIAGWAESDEVDSYRPFWIVNAVAVSATPAVITALADRPEVDLAIPNVPIQTLRPMASGPADESPNGTEYGLRQINAPALWHQGITGEGSIICNIDTGVLLEHPAVTTRWRGNRANVPNSHAWFDAVGHQDRPYDDDFMSPTHGSHTMGTLCGLDAATRDTIGVAFGAEWIAAKSFNQTGSGTIADAIAAFQWASDPDQNLKTVQDVPHVISNSWGLMYPFCDNQVWGVMDAAEAMGAAVVFAVGNSGPLGPGSPASRITDPLNAFSVGATDSREQIAGFSSKGPSKCDRRTIKPEVSAPGVDVRSIRQGSYGILSGTSMATPHVSGALALLRQVDPTASVPELKRALYVTARDAGARGEDNQYGRGIIDVAAAAAILNRPTRVQVAADGPGIVSPGDLAELQLTFTNLTEESQSFEFWVGITAPVGDERVGMLRSLHLEAGQVLTLDITRSVHETLGAGNYLFRAYVGDFPFAKSTDGFKFTVVR